MTLTVPSHEGVNGMLRRLDALTGQPVVTIRDITVAFGESGFVPMLMVPALIVVSPLSGIPLLSTAMGTTIALIALQMLVGRRHLWLPPILMRRQLSGDRLHRAIGRLQRVAAWIDSHARNRLTSLVHPPLDMLPKALCALCGGAMPLLELVPFSSSLLALAVLLFSASLLLRDGLYTLLGSGVIAFAAMVPVWIYGSMLGL